MLHYENTVRKKLEGYIMRIFNIILLSFFFLLAQPMLNGGACGTEFQPGRDYDRAAYLLSNITRSLRDYHCEEQDIAYLKNLAASKELSDQQKIKLNYIMIPFFKRFIDAPQKAKDRLFKMALSNTNSATYPLTRLLLAGLCCAGANPDKHKRTVERALAQSLSKKDIALTQLLLQCGASPNLRNFSHKTPINIVQTVPEAISLIKHGAHLHEEDIVKPLLLSSSEKRDPKLIPLFISHMPHPQGNFGSKWIITLAIHASDHSTESLSTRLFLLLRHGCHYDEQAVMRTLERNTFFFEREAIKQIFVQGFAQDKKRRQPLIRGIFNRQLTGHHLKTTTHWLPVDQPAIEGETSQNEHPPLGIQFGHLRMHANFILSGPLLGVAPSIF